VLIDLPVHWRTAVWVLACRLVGAVPVLGAAGSPGAAEADVVVTDRPGAHPGADQLVAQPLAALAARWPGDLPPGALDAAVAVRGQGDVHVALHRGTDPELARAGARAAAHGWPDQVRLLVRLPRDDPDATDWLFGPLLRDGSVVLVAEGATGDVAAIAGQEGVTAWL
jgi:uncharacterized protein (TIGR03089 family)